MIPSKELLQTAKGFFISASSVIGSTWGLKIIFLPSLKFLGDENIYNVELKF